MSEKDFDTKHLSDEQKKIATVILAICRETYGGDASGGGCSAFFTPEEWIERDELYGRDSALVVVHDGGDLRAFFNLDVMEYTLYDKMTKALDKIGYRFDQCTGWYSAIYPRR